MAAPLVSCGPEIALEFAGPGPGHNSHAFPLGPFTRPVQMALRSTEDDSRAAEHKIALLVQKVDTIHSSATCVQALFTPQVTAFRGKIQQHCLAICLNPELSNDSARKAEDTLWRKLFHNIVHSYKTLKSRQPKQIEVDLVRNHLTTGLGFYSNFIQMIASASNLNMSTLDHLKVRVPFETKAGYETLDERKMDQIRARQAVLRSLIYLGDLCRYLDDLGSPGSRRLAVYWYNNALLWDPSVGMPHNQLATLFSGVNCDIDSCYHYLLCITSEKPFEGAEANLKRLMSRSLFPHGLAMNKFSTPTTAANSSFDSGDENIVGKTMKLFLSISYSLLYSSKQKTPFSDSLEEFNHCYMQCIEKLKEEPSLKQTPQKSPPVRPFGSKEMSSSTISSSTPKQREKINSQPDHLTNDITFKMAIMALMILMKCPSYAKPNALVLVVNFYFTLIAHCERSCKKIVQQFQHEPLSNSGFNGSGMNKLQYNCNANSPLGTRKNRRRRRRCQANTSDDSDGESDESEALLEKIALRTIDALDITSDVSDDDLLSSEDEVEKAKVPDQVTCRQVESEEESSLSAKLYTESPLATLKVYCDWIGANPHFFDSLEQTTFQGDFCQNLAQILEQVVSHDQEQLGQSVRKDSCHGNEQQAQKCLSVDFALAKFPLLPQSQTFDVSRACFSYSQSGYICACSVLQFITAKRANALSL